MNIGHFLFIQLNLFVLLPSLGILCVQIFKEKKIRYRWICLSSAGVILFLLWRSFSLLPGTRVSPYLQDWIRFPLWLLIPYSFRIAVERKLPPPYLWFLAGMTLADIIITFLPFVPIPVRVWMFCFLYLHILMAVMIPAIRIDEIRDLWLRRISLLYFLALLGVLLLLFPSLILPAALGKGISLAEVLPLINGSVLIHSLCTVLFVIRSLSRGSMKSDELRIDRMFVEKYGITRKEREILMLLIEGYTSKAISKKVCLSPQTVKNYTQKVYQKTGVNNKIQLINIIISETVQNY